MGASFHICPDKENITTSIKTQRVTYIGVELSNKAGEVVVLEVVREEVAGEFGRSPYDKGGGIFTPRYNVICGWVINQLVGLCEKWGWNWLVGVQGENAVI